MADHKKIRTHLKDLYNNKNYLEIIFEIDRIYQEDERDSFLHNLYGICKILSPNRSKKDLVVALANFKSGYLKEKNSLQSYHS